MSDDQRARLREQLIEHEGLRLRPYVDTEGKLTVGVGYNLDDRGVGPASKALGRKVTRRELVDKGLTREEALRILDADLDDCIRDLASFPWFVALDPVRQRALVDLRFNVGPSRFRGFRQMLNALALGQIDRAADEMQRSRWFHQVKRRGPRVVAMLRTGEDAA